MDNEKKKITKILEKETTQTSIRHAIAQAVNLCLLTS
jgi:hypothetical protein